MSQTFFQAAAKLGAELLESGPTLVRDAIDGDGKVDLTSVSEDLTEFLRNVGLPIPPEFKITSLQIETHS